MLTKIVRGQAVMDNQLDEITAPGWLRKMWARRQRQPGWYLCSDGLLHFVVLPPNMVTGYVTNIDNGPSPDVGAIEREE